MPEVVFENKPVRAGIVCPQVTGRQTSLKGAERLAETEGLAAAIRLDVVFSRIVALRQIRPDAYFGRGVADRLAAEVAETGAELLIVDAALSPIQQRNLEKLLNIKVIDRTALILEIFGERAQTREGCLQVELAHLTYQRSRLVRSWTHLERQRGGAGFLGGPGETQIELDRRIIDDKIVKIKKALEKIKQTRGLQRTARQKVPFPIVALVGYTNTGKSTLFNRLTAAGVFAENLLFATLDTTMRRLVLPSRREIILSDTVGFISDLPHELIMAFRATLEEVLNADIVVQVLDAANPENKQQRSDVLEVLHRLGLDRIEHRANYLELYNKVDLLPEETAARLASGKNTLAISALTGRGLDKFLQWLDATLSQSEKEYTISLPSADGAQLSWLYANAEVISQKSCEENLHLLVRMSDAAYQKWRQKFGSDN